MGRVLLKNSRQSTYRNLALRKMSSSGISKQLSAAEKRKRMLEAGAKYAAYSRKIKGNSLEKTKSIKFNFKVKALNRDARSVRFRKKESPRINDHVSKPCNQLVPEHPVMTDCTKTPVKGTSEMFVRDDTALSGILNKLQPHSLSGRASIYRSRERPSLFPNGINPFDAAVQKFAKPLSLSAVAANSFSLPVDVSPKVDPVPFLSTPEAPMKSTKKTPAKMVRFDETVDIRSSKINTPVLPKTTNKMILDLEMKFDDILERLRILPAHVFNDLEEAVHRVSTEKSLATNAMCNVHVLRSTVDSKIAEPEIYNTLPNNCLSSVPSIPPNESNSCIALRTRRRTRLSNAHVNQHTHSVGQIGKKKDPKELQNC